MSMQISVDELFDYTAWQREKWFEQMRKDGGQVLKASAGAHGDGRFQVVGELVRHIFSAEQRYADRLLGRALTDTASVPHDNLQALYQFSQQSREDFQELVKNLAQHEWDTLREFKIMDHVIRATPRKIVTHTLMHEIRHWAQIATLSRLSGLMVEPHDFLLSPVMGGEFRPKA